MNVLFIIAVVLAKYICDDWKNIVHMWRTRPSPRLRQIRKEVVKAMKQSRRDCFMTAHLDPKKAALLKPPNTIETYTTNADGDYVPMKP